MLDTKPIKAKLEPIKGIIAWSLRQKNIETMQRNIEYVLVLVEQSVDKNIDSADFEKNVNRLKELAPKLQFNSKLQAALQLGVDSLLSLRVDYLQVNPGFDENLVKKVVKDEAAMLRNKIAKKSSQSKISQEITRKNDFGLK